MNISATADQARAAQEHGVRILAGVAAISGAPVEQGPPGPAINTWIDELGRRLTAHEVDVCTHARTPGPQPLLWHPWAPGRLRCPACADRRALAIRGTVEDRRCDRCRHLAPVGYVHRLAALLPAVMVTRPDGSATAFGPIIVAGGVCPTCFALERAAVA